MKNLEMDAAAWREGYLAGMQQQQGSDSNPYPVDDDRSWAWASGYIEGKATPDTLPQLRPIPR
jgi:hypothetical protein